MFKFTQIVVPFKILIVDADKKITGELYDHFRKEGFDVHLAASGEEALVLSLKILPDLILLDIVLPDMDGVELCQHIKENILLKDSLIVFYTERTEDYSQLAAFAAGADDYLLKPMRPRVLCSRIKALFKRVNQKVEHQNCLSSGDLKIDLEHFLVMKGKQTIQLPRKEFKLLSLLATKPGKVFTRDKIISEVWGNAISPGDRTIDVHIRKLREKIGEKYITTVKGLGYKLENKIHYSTND
jgi:two-component system, OmpR family, alkaline phosphatase synthesis response regulator PhoP